jgi:hypothetical protein
MRPLRIGKTYSARSEVTERALCSLIKSQENTDLLSYEYLVFRVAMRYNECRRLKINVNRLRSVSGTTHEGLTNGARDAGHIRRLYAREGAQPYECITRQ